MNPKASNTLNQEFSSPVSEPKHDSGLHPFEDLNPISLHQVVEVQAQYNPNATALSMNGQEMSYRVLNSRANQVAHQLRALGVKQEDLVALCFERSFEMIVAILGVLKAGGAYLPLDSGYPVQRLRFLIEDSKPRLILTSGLHAGLSESVPELQQLRIDDPAIDSRPTTDGNAPCIDRHHPAYVIYTSGSTGNPKGVPISHHQVLRLFSSTDAWFHFGPGDVWTLFHSYAFDFSVWEIWGALLYGGKLVIVPRETSRNPSEFLKLTLKEKVTVLNQTPSAFRQFIWADAGLKPNPADEALRLVIFGGEALELQSLRPWYERHGDQRPVLVNMYGITETTVHVTYRPILKADVDARKGSVIGVPIPDLQVHLLDQNLRPVPRGTPGEICVGGDGVASGYLNREALTRARFIPNPFSNRKEDRLYRSGDLARITPDGELEYLGRIDDQVKIRGFRVELGEIESHLNQIPGVKGSVVQAVETEGHQEKVLVGYVAMEGTFQVARLRRELERRLPSHMIPGIFVRIDEIPLTINGKVDRKALPWPFNRPELSTEFAPPANEVEARLCRIWSRVLEIPQVGVCDNFFELGGDSIRSIRIVSEAGQEGIHFTSWDLFHHKTVRALTGKCLMQTSRDQNQEKASEPFSLVTPEDRSRLPDGLQDAYPATRLQAGMLFHSEFNPRSAVFHDIFSFLIHQRFEEIPMREALTGLVGRHEILRTSFELGKYSHPLQLVHPQISVPLSYENLSQKSAVEQESCLIRWIEEEKRNPLDWNRPPLLRFHAQILSESSFQFIVSFHHAILDGWSLAALLTEIFQDYSSLLHHEPIRTSTPTIRFREYVRLEREALENQEHKDFWLEKLQNPTLATLPRWPRVYRDGGLEQRRGPEVPIPGELFAGMKALSHRLEVPLRPLLLAAHYRVLQVLTGVDDLITGLVLNGRPEDHDGEKMIGLFLNTVPLRVRLNGGTWAELIRHCFEAEQEAIPHRRFPLAEIQQLHGNRLLFETALDFVHFHVYRDLEGYHGDGVSEGHYFEANNFIFFPTFMMNAPSTALQMHIDYDPEQIAWDQVNLICPYYINCLESMVREPERKYVSFSPLEKKERKTVVYSWNETARNFPEADCIHHFFERNARETPSAIAVRSARGQLSYQEVDQEAEQVAHFLRSRGIGQGSLVAVHLKRTLELVPALLGILKAGAAYVPVDSHLPNSRVHWLLNETGAEALIAHSDKVQTIVNARLNLPGLGHILVMNEDRQVARIPEELKKLGSLMAKAVTQQELPTPSPQERHSVGVRPSDLAYIIFTSGSTGTPKGVMVKHQPVCNLIDWVNQEFKVSARDQLLFVTSPAFDLSVYDVFGILAAGGVVRIASEEESRDPEMLLDILNRESITFWDSAPAALQQLVPFLDSAGRNRTLRRIFLSGDWIPVPLPDTLRSYFQNAEITALGGATEATIWSNYYPIREVDPRWTSIPYGRPIQNARYYILDERLEPSPIGVPGHLFIGGDCLAEGYFKDADLTARKFVPDPFAIDAREGPSICKTSGTARMYETGDLARYLPDGNIEFLGRTDHQVKIRGFRVELGEIEAALREYPGVKQGLVIASSDNQGERRLIAYLQSADKHEPDSIQIREFLERRLPDYMVPSHFINVSAFPLTPNGKIDRTRLPKPNFHERTSNRIMVPPSTDSQRQILEIWRQVLGVEKLGIRDDFFELGGHSLLATQVVMRIRHRLGIHMPLRFLFDYPTIEQLDQKIQSAKPTAEMIPSKPPRHRNNRRKTGDLAPQA